MPVVAVLADVERADRYRLVLQLHELGRQPRGEVISFGQDADEHDALRAAVSLHDLVRDARQRTADLVGVHHGRLEPALRDAHESNRSRRAMRTGIPFRACRKYAARGSSSTSVAISSTRGSGCITIAYLRIWASELLSMR